MLISNSTEGCQHPLAWGQRFSSTGGLKLKQKALLIFWPWVSFALMFNWWIVNISGQYGWYGKVGKKCQKICTIFVFRKKLQGTCVLRVCVLKPREESSVQNNNSSSRKSSPDSSFGMWKMLKVSGYIQTGDHLHANDRNLNLCLV